MLDKEDYELFKKMLTELRIKNDLEILRMKIELGQETNRVIEKRINEIEEQRD